ncbi:phosphatidylinositol N-acetylglucosaminyltransferase subunit Gpi1p [[Candida] railenensis]|uniref:Phosphatidylinositol N-acetylglucosaminyltransferase subunit Gpi1p n=1 Tax=[Candida] railenensis TaxID=45579 RepID=A0A9P0QLR9_9ASCO|nr:phosphatidylinositol N-acetylglucosaminyltransferase subunit Gpi1p [[Candida] railenensis]
MLGVLRKSRKKRSTGEFHILGFKYTNIYIVIQLATNVDTFNQQPVEGPLRGLQVIGTVNGKESSISGLNLVYNDSTDYPTIKSGENERFTFVLFQPPKYKNLEYLSIDPILLQSAEGDHGDYDPRDEKLKIINKKFNNIANPTITENTQPFNTEVLDIINQCYQIRSWYETWHRSSNNLKNQEHTGVSAKTYAKKLSRYIIFKPLTIIVACIQTIAIWLIHILNYEYGKNKREPNSRGIKITQFSAVFRQLELRLKQFNYFPIQFLCYLDRTLLYDENESMNNKNGLNKYSLALNLPIFNSNLNINNSNYINFHNSVWLIVNDILFGMSIQKLIFANYSAIAKFINETAIKKILFDDLYALISWVSFRHPAGFKLNNELGRFVGDLFLWTLRFWRLLCVDIFTISEKESSTGGWYVGGGDLGDAIKEIGGFGIKGFRVFDGKGPLTSPLFQTILSIICHIGVSFLVGFLIDYLQIISFHIYCFYYTSAKIYKRQVEILKSLFQLFCGKKYNVLRNRIDNLDNYSMAGGSGDYEVDQLLLGTLIFVVLILLLPTIFAFYLMFFLTRLLCLLLIYIGESLLVIMNFFPIFVILLKLKNSKRLQGGLTFTFITSNDENVTYLQLSNKSLTYKEIFKNFLKLFRNSKTFTLQSTIPNFVNGDPISLIQQNELKFNYLMLPRNYDQTINAWNHFTNTES